MSKTETTNGYKYLNPSTEEWEWCAVRPSEDEAIGIKECTKEDFYEEFPNHD